jgi:aryl-phospho-beta-D-glucosidase BglC (GH1 family)
MKASFLWIAVFALLSCKKNSPGQIEPYNFPGGLPMSLQKGINLSNWFNDYSDPSKFAIHFTPVHFAKIKQLGFTFVRIPIGNTILFQPDNPSQLKSYNLPFVDSAVKMATDAGLAVVINYHPWQEDFEKQMFYDPSKSNELAAYWQSIASYFKKYTNQQIFFEVYNEPHISQSLGVPNLWTWWWPLQEKIIQAIRSAAPKHYIIAGNEGWNNIDYLTKSVPYDQQGIVYNFHFYEPFVFTHQGATWVGDTWKLLHDVPYPATPENVAPLITASNNQDVKNLLTWYGNYRVNADSLDKMIKVAADWSKAYNVPLTCNEFGVYKVYAPPADRAQCIHDVRSSLEKYGIGWAMWECDEGFGLFEYPDGNRDHIVVDANISISLGLN